MAKPNPFAKKDEKTKGKPAPKPVKKGSKGC